MPKRQGKPNLPLVYSGMKITVFLETYSDPVGFLCTARVTKTSGGRSFQFRRTSAAGVREGNDRSMRRTSYRTTWVKGWDDDEANAFRAQHLLLKD